MEKLMTIQEVADVLHVTATTLRRWEKNGKIKPIRTFGNHRRYKLSDIQNIVTDK